MTIKIIEGTMPDNTPASLYDAPKERALTVIYNDQPPNTTEHLQTTKDIISLSMTNKSMYSLFKPLSMQRLLKHLMLYVLQGEPTLARQIYSTFPELLFLPITETDLASGLDNNFEPVYRVIKSTPLRAIIGGGDIWMLDQVWKALPNYHDKIIEQFDEQFPDGSKYPEATFDYTALVETIAQDEQLIESGNPSEKTIAELNKFRTHFLPNQDRSKETSGHHFNLNEYVRAAAHYNAHRQTWNGHRARLFFTQVLGLLQRLLSVSDGQALLQNPDTAQTPGNVWRLRRNLTFKNIANGNVKQVLFDRHSESVHGWDFAIDAYLWKQTGGDAKGARIASKAVPDFSLVIAQKSGFLAGLYHGATQPTDKLPWPPRFAK